MRATKFLDNYRNKDLFAGIVILNGTGMAVICFSGLPPLPFAISYGIHLACALLAILYTFKL